jgi:uncharacterized membrane protein YuzA (DUF378 family)
MSKSYMRGIDVCVAVLLVIGGLNWGLVAFFGFDLVAYLFGSRLSSNHVAIYPASLGVFRIYETCSKYFPLKRLAPFRLNECYRKGALIFRSL